jgi:short-subunit dehydrogenase
MSNGGRKTQEYALRYGPWALVTGAAQGIGSAFAELLAGRGLNLLLVDKQEAELQVVAAALRERYGVQTRPVIVDLARADFIDTVRAETADLSVGLLISNAALGQVGPFLSENVDSLQAALDINCRAPAILAHVFGTQMAQRGQGGIILMASGTAFYGNPFVAHYAATKAYNLVLGEGLWYELRQRGVDVLAYIPGPTNTPGLRKSQPTLKEGVAAGMVKLPVQTAEAALNALGKGPSAARDLRMTLQVAVATRLLPRRKIIEIFGDRLSRLQRTR